MTCRNVAPFLAFPLGIALSLGLVTALTAPPVHAQSTHFEVRVVSAAAPPTVTILTALNNTGWIAGHTGDPVAFIDDGTGLRPLAPLPGQFASRASRLLDNGRVIGQSVDNNAVSRAAVWDPLGNPLELRTPAGYDAAYPLDGNGRGVIVGMAAVDGVVEDRPVAWRNGVLELLATPPGLPFGQMYAVNNAGTMAGYAWGPGHEAEGYTIDAQGAVVPIGIPPGYGRSFLFDINEAGVAVGAALDLTVSAAVGLYYRDGQATTVPQAFPGSTLLQRVNRSGIAVGSTVQGSFSIGVITDGSKLVDLNDVLDPVTGAGFRVWAATDVNNLGQVVGWGADATGALLGCVLTPVPAPPG